MKAYLTTDERWPDYELTTNPEYYDAELEVTEDELARANKIINDYNELQLWLHNKLKNSTNSPVKPTSSF